jgi:glycosyltransferase involved in cell wall biosynthesis
VTHKDIHAKNVLLFIRSLHAGGAERQLITTAIGLAARGHCVTVLTCYSGGEFENELLNNNVTLLSLDKKGRWDFFPVFFRLIKLLHARQFHTIYSFMGAANILSAISRPFIRSTRLVWGIRSSNMNLKAYDWLSQFSYYVEGRLSRFADTIIANSYAGAEHAIRHGFPKEKMTVIPNGIDTELFHPDETAGKLQRKNWDVEENSTLIGAAGRIDPIKGAPTFLKAVSILKRQNPRLRFIWIGKGEKHYQQSMHTLAEHYNLGGTLTWAGNCSNMVAAYNALDILVSSSHGEGFPNVIGEAMACGTRCVATDVGDTAQLIGPTGAIVQANNPDLLANAITAEMSSLHPSDQQRARIMENFSVKKLIHRTEKVIFE